jgi:YD repeat-containing protein
MKFRQRSLALVVMLLVASVAFGEGPQVRYFRHLAFNHNSPFMSYTPVNEISAEQAKNAEHYEVVYDASGRVTEMRNYSSEAWRNHPLTHMGVYRMTIRREGAREIREFFDREGQRARNLRQVYKEVYTLDADGFRRELEFFDLNNKPMDSNWGVARYAWEKKDGWVIEGRYNVKGEFAPLAPSFQFHISALRLNALGHIEEHCNLNDKLEIIDSNDGLACYRDLISAEGNLLNVSYTDKSGREVNSPWRFSVVRLTYDANGNPVVEEMTDKNGVLLSRENFAYDATGKLLPKH